MGQIPPRFSYGLGAVIYIVAELLSVAKRFKTPELVMWGLFIGFLPGYARDLMVTFAGA